MMQRRRSPRLKTFNPLRRRRYWQPVQSSSGGAAMIDWRTRWSNRLASWIRRQRHGLSSAPQKGQTLNRNHAIEKCAKLAQTTHVAERGVYSDSIWMLEAFPNRRWTGAVQ